MRLFKLCSLAAAVIAATSVTAQADFINDSSLDVKIRSAHFDYDRDNNPSNYDQWSLGGELNFTSGYIADIIGFDASYYGAMKLDHGGASNNPDLDYGSAYSSSSGRGQLLGKGGKNYQKLGQAYMKAKVGDDQLGGYGQAGYMRGKNGLILGSTSRTTPASYRGALAEMNVQDFWFHAGYVDRIGQRTETSWDEFTSATGKKIDYAWQLGGNYKANGLYVDANYLESKDYLKQYTSTVGYTFDLAEDMSLLVEGILFGARSNGSIWDKEALLNSDNNLKGESEASATPGFDDKGYVYNLTTQLNVKGFGLALTYAETKAEKEGGKLGYLNDSFASNEYGGSPSRVSRYVSDFWHDGEKVWQLEGSYNFADLGVPGLNTSLTYTHGTGMNTPDNPVDANQTLEKEHETNFIASYDIQEGTFKGLSFKVIKAWNTQKYKAQDNIKTEHIRAYIDYTISVF